MASFTKREYTSWQVTAKDSSLKIKKTFLNKVEAQAFSAQLHADKIDSTLTRTSTIAWQVRIRKKGFPELTETFPTKASAIAWAVEREAEMLQRKFVDYREAERNTLGDLLRKYDATVLKGKKSSDPDRVRIRKMSRHPITLIPMHMLQKSDVASYRDQRLEGGFVEAAEDRKLSLESRTWKSIKGSSVKKEMELMARAINLSIREWNIHIPFNPASGTQCTRPAEQEGDQRNRRLEDRRPERDSDGTVGSAERGRRVHQDKEYALDPDVQAMLQAADGEQINLLRACRYPEWFRPQKKNVKPAALHARKLSKVSAKRLVKARLRPGVRLWAIVSFAIETAMRRNEILSLRWEHVRHNTDGSYLLLPASITKTKKERVVPLTLRAERILKTQLRRSALVFNTNYETVKTAYRRAKERVRIKDLRMHDLRHEATSRLFENTDLRDQEIGAITGHENSRSLKRYTNLRAPYQVKRFHQSKKRV